MSEYKLCYVSGEWAYFTTQPLSEAWGDDWNDCPYEHNAGMPYEYAPYHKERNRASWKIVVIGIRGHLYEPADFHTHNSPWSVEDINAGKVPWLTSRPPYLASADGPFIEIMAGTPLATFVHLVQAAGGQLFFPILESGVLDLEVLP